MIVVTQKVHIRMISNMAIDIGIVQVEINLKVSMLMVKCMVSGRLLT